VKDASPSALAAVPAADAIDTKVALIQALIPLGLHAVGEALKAEVGRPWPANATAGRVGAQAWSAGGSNRARSTSPISEESRKGLDFAI
jgi:hypothetical protein